MKKGTNHKYREIIERYCNIIDANAAIVRTDCDKDITYECLSRAECEKKFGGCKNTKYGNM
ncbi:MAG: hypothetical protein IKI97_12725 [Clostridia bacterium]|nr:hypothetical protein [Clostridia bacterium]